MDVRIEVSLLGGHVWDFVCDEAYPLVFGLVSALPGVTADANLPVDGLIQIERRSGDRIYFTRSSLVSVAVFPAGDRAVVDAQPGLHRLPGAGASGARSMRVDDVFQPASRRSLIAMLPKKIQDHQFPGLIALDDGNLDACVGEDIVRLATTVRSTLMSSNLEDATLEVDFFRLETDEAIDFAVSSSDLLWIGVVVPSDPSPTSSCEITMIGSADSLVDGAPAETVVLPANAAYAIVGGRGHVEVRATMPSQAQWTTVARIVMRVTKP